MFYRCDRSAQPQNAAISPIDQNENPIEQIAKVRQLFIAKIWQFILNFVSLSRYFSPKIVKRTQWNNRL